MKLAGNVARKNLISMGTCFGKFTGSQTFKLHITALDFISPYAKVKTFIEKLYRTCHCFDKNRLVCNMKLIT